MKLGKNHDLLTSCDLILCAFMLYFDEHLHAQVYMKSAKHACQNTSCKAQPICSPFASQVACCLGPFLAADDAPDISRGISVYIALSQSHANA